MSRDYQAIRAREIREASISEQNQPSNDHEMGEKMAQIVLERHREKSKGNASSTERLSGSSDDDAQTILSFDVRLPALRIIYK